MKSFVFILLLIAITSSAYSQDRWATTTWEIFEQTFDKASVQYKASQYYVDLKYSSFKGLNSTQPFETSIGYYQKNGKFQQNYIMGITTIQDDKIKLTLDSINQIVAINYAVGDLNNTLSKEEFEQSKKMIETLKKGESESGIKFQVNYVPTSPVRTIEYSFNKKGELKSMSIYYAEQKEYEDEEGNVKKDHVWLKIEFLRFENKIAKKELKISELVLESNNEFKLKPLYRDFELVDFRYKK